MNPPVFGHGELRLVLLTLIAREPRHGYDLIHALNEHFEGDYSPSAGTIYPRLAKLQEEGLVTKTQDGRKTVYSISEAGRREVEERRGEFERITTERTDAVRTIAQSARAGLAQARRGLREELEQIATQARTAAEEALFRERAAAEAEAAAKATAEAQAKADAAEQAANERIAKAEQRARQKAAERAGGQAPHESSTDAPRSFVGTPAGPDATISESFIPKAEGPDSTNGSDTASGSAAAGGTTAASEDSTRPTASHAGDQPAHAGAQTGAAPGTEAGAESGTEPTPETDPSLMRAQLIRRVDVALQQFRMELRHDARESNQLGGLDEDTVSELETQLRELRRRLGSLLRVHR